MTKEEIVKDIANNKMLPYINPDFLPWIVDFVLDNFQPSLPSNLDEAAEEYSENILANNEDLQDAIEDAFKAGAKWAFGQGVIYKTYISSHNTIPVLPMKDVSDFGLDEGDKVIV